MREPTIIEGYEGGYPVLAVGYFAEDDTDVVCVHKREDREGAERCLESLKEEAGNDG